MKINPDTPWIIEDGPHGEIVICSRARLARNLAGFPFVSRASDEQRREIAEIARTLLADTGGDGYLNWHELTQVSARDRRLLVERNLISENLAEGDGDRAVLISKDGSLSIMVNEEDHIRMQKLAPGLQLDFTYRELSAIDQAIESNIEYAYCSTLGYLTACPTNVGTGVRFSVMVHLPALTCTREIEKVQRSARELHLAVRGFRGEGSDSAGDFYQISNQITLGQTEDELLNNLQQKILPTIINWEQRARTVMLDSDRAEFDDRVHRALGCLQSARLLTVEEAMAMLSRIRLGVHMGRLPDMDRPGLNRMFFLIQPAHLQNACGETLDEQTMNIHRAELVRQFLS